MSSALMPPPATIPASDNEFERRYAENFGLPEPVDAARIRTHLALERALTESLLASTAEDRAATFRAAYDRLYAELPWLRETGGSGDPSPWVDLLPAPPASIYEVGAGAGRLAAALAARGYEVEATDISGLRGPEEGARNVRWSETDGVHLSEFAARAPYDAVISDQLLEHLHPDDARRHFEEARRILKPGGRYLCRTPQALTGPHDVSRVFGYERPAGMHLREYRVRDLAPIARAAGFSAVAAPLLVPRALRRWLGGRSAIGCNAAYRRYQELCERILAAIDPPKRRWLIGALPQPAVPKAVVLVATR